MATRPERRPRGQDRRGAARCRPVFPLRDWHEGGKSTPSVPVCTLPYLPTPVSPFHAEPLQRDINHRISKDLIASAKGTDRGVALEDLEGIRERTTVHRQQRDRFNGWAHAQLGGFIVYKAQLAGVAVEFIDPAYTSQTCHACGHCERGNRKSQAEFVCKACGHTEHADVNAARNIRARAVRQAAHRDGKGRSRDDRLMPSTVASTRL